jgi:hypothetical protein
MRTAICKAQTQLQKKKLSAMIFSCHNLKELVFFDGVKLMILKKSHLFHSLFSRSCLRTRGRWWGKEVPPFAILVTLAFHEKDDSQVVVF